MMSHHQPPDSNDHRVMGAAILSARTTNPNWNAQHHDDTHEEIDVRSPTAVGSMEEPRQAPTPPSERSSRLRTFLVVLLSSTIVLIFIDAQTTRYLETLYTSLVDWLSSHVLFGIFVIILIYILATILFIPGSILTIGTGYAFHQAMQQQQYSNAVILAVLGSSVAVFVGATSGSIICFLLGRYMFRDYVVQMANRYEIFRAVDRGTS